MAAVLIGIALFIVGAAVTGKMLVDGNQLVAIIVAVVFGVLVFTALVLNQRCACHQRAAPERQNGRRRGGAQRPFLSDVPHVHPHRFRHDTARRLVEAVDLPTVAAMLGHGRLDTVRHYARPDAAAMEPPPRHWKSAEPTAREHLVETVIRADLDDLWHHTQTLELHARWDLRFTDIRCGLLVGFGLALMQLTALILPVVGLALLDVVRPLQVPVRA